MISIKTKYNTEFPSHRDIFVQWPELKLIELVDSYYLVLDRAILPDIETFEKALLVLRKILLNWQVVVRKLRTSETVYLPFDFSDEYVGFLKVTMNETMLEVRYGATQKVCGWNGFPSQNTPLPINSDDEAFIEPEVVSISVEEFIAQIEQSIQNLGS